MDKPYRVAVNTLTPLDLGLLTYQIREGELKDTFTLLLHAPSDVIIRTASGDKVLIQKTGFDYPFGDPLDEYNIICVVSAAINLAKILERHSAKFNPNFLYLLLGHFRNDSAFETNVGPVAGIVQRRLYSGGNVYYFQSSNDYSVFLGTEEFTSKKRGPMIPKKLTFIGIAQPANSLDELLARIEQK